jgi:hypothetical protein
VLHASATVNSGAAMLACGGGLLYAGLLWEQRRLHTAVLVGSTLIVLLIDRNNVLAAGFIGLYLLLRAMRRGSRSDRRGDRMARSRYITMAGVVLGGALVTWLVLPALHEALIGETKLPAPAPVPEATAVQHVPEEIVSGPVTTTQIVGQVAALVTPVQNPFIPAFLSGSVTVLGVTILNWLILGALFAAAWRSPSGGVAEALAVAALAIMVLTGPLHAIANAQRDVFFATPARFGLPLLPALAALLADCLNKQPALHFVILMAVAFAGNTVLALA